MMMSAMVLEVNHAELFVLDLNTSREVFVSGENIPDLHPQDYIRIEFDEPLEKTSPLRIVAKKLTFLASCACGHVHSS